MSISLVYVCDGCGLRNDDRRDLLADPEILVPDGWLITDEMLFHDDECYRDWLRRMGKVEELAAFDDAIALA